MSAELPREQQTGFGLSFLMRHFTFQIRKSGFSAEFAKHCCVAMYLYANKLAKDGPVALIETYVLMFHVSLCSSYS